MAQTSKGQIRVFVYGTLKSRKQNNTLLLSANAVCEGYDSITGPYQLCELMGIPALMHHGEGEAPTRTIQGEIWYGGQEMLEALDILEGNNILYRRIKLWSDRTKQRVWVYFILPIVFKELNDGHSLKILSVVNWDPIPAEITFWNNAVAQETVNEPA